MLKMLHHGDGAVTLEQPKTKLPGMCIGSFLILWTLQSLYRQNKYLHACEGTRCQSRQSWSPAGLGKVPHRYLWGGQALGFLCLWKEGVFVLSWLQGDSLSCRSSWTWPGGSCSSPGPPGEQLLESSAGSWELMNSHSKAFSSKAQVASPNGKVSLLIWPVFCYFEHIPRSDLFPSVPYGVDTFLLLCCPYKTFHWSLILCFAEILH